MAEAGAGAAMVVVVVACAAAAAEVMEVVATGCHRWGWYGGGASVASVTAGTTSDRWSG